MAAVADLRLGVDIGGTFTDIILLGADGTLFSKKVLSTPDDYSRAIEEGVRDLLAEIDVTPDRISAFAHGTTVGTNTIIERKGVKVALLTTAGFRDVLELGRYRSPHLYDLSWRRPEPLVERRLRFEVPERTAGDGTVLRPVEEAAIDDIAAAIRTEGIKSVAICFVNSYLNPANERTATRLLAERIPDALISASTQVQPQIQEFERTSTTVVNAYIRPVLSGYVESLERRLKNLEIGVPLMIMQSSGGTVPGDVAAKNPIYIIESGPAAGVVGAQRVGAHVGLGDLMVLDMGGTTAKASIVEGGTFSIASETEVGGGAALGHRLIKGAGYVVQVPTIDIAEVGAGGGSIATIDSAGGLQVGPRSAGAAPGPICYARGGREPTVTDANLMLGYLNPTQLVGGELLIDFELAASAVDAFGQRIEMTRTEIAYGIHLIANANMMRALKGVSSERGRDPSQYTLLAMGGNGGIHAANLAESLRVTTIVVPPVAGLFSALGLLFADVEHHLAATFYRLVAELELPALNAAFKPLADNALAMLESEGYGAREKHRLNAFAEVKYVGQTSPLTVALGEYPVGAERYAQLPAEFGALHEQVYGYRSDRERLQIAAVKIIGQGVSDTPRVPDRIARDREGQVSAGPRNAYFGPDHGWRSAPVMARTALGAEAIDGPAIIEEYDTTTIVRPGWTARRDHWNNIVMERLAT